MASGDILAAITSNQTQMAVLAENMKKLEQKIERQEHVIHVYARKKDFYESELNYRVRQSECVVAFEPTSVIVKRFQAKSDDIMGPRSVSVMKNKLYDVEEKMIVETKLHINTLENQKVAYNQCNSRISQLQEDYKSAMAAEEAERQRQAAVAAAQNAANSSKR